MSNKRGKDCYKINKLTPFTRVVKYVNMYNNKSCCKGGVVKMAQDAILKITEVEKKADEKILAAQAQARKIIADAEKCGEASLDTARAEAEAKVQEMMARAEDAAAGASLEITSGAERECEKLRALAKGRMNEAALFIAEKVVKG